MSWWVCCRDRVPYEGQKETLKDFIGALAGPCGAPVKSYGGPYAAPAGPLFWDRNRDRIFHIWDRNRDRNFHIGDRIRDRNFHVRDRIGTEIISVQSCLPEYDTLAQNRQVIGGTDISIFGPKFFRSQFGPGIFRFGQATCLSHRRPLIQLFRSLSKSFMGASVGSYEFPGGSLRGLYRSAWGPL